MERAGAEGSSGEGWGGPAEAARPAPGRTSREARAQGYKKPGPAALQTWDPAPAMASGAQFPPRPAASDEVRADPRLGGRPAERTEEMALSLLLPPPPWNVSLPPATQRRFPEACQPGAARLPEPSARRSPRLAARTPRAAGPAADATPAPPPPSLGPERRLVPCDLEGLLDERRMAAHLKLALSREARLWRGGRPQVPVPAAEPSREHLHPPPHVRTGRGRAPPAPALR